MYVMHVRTNTETYCRLDNMHIAKSVLCCSRKHKHHNTHALATHWKQPLIFAVNCEGLWENKLWWVRTITVFYFAYISFMSCLWHKMTPTYSLYKRDLRLATSLNIAPWICCWLALLGVCGVGLMFAVRFYDGDTLHKTPGGALWTQETTNSKINK